MSRARTRASLFSAAIESARIFNGVVAECAVASGLLRGLGEFAPAGEIRRRFRFHPTKDRSFEALLAVLVEQRLVETRLVDGTMVYRAARAALAGRLRLDGGLMRTAPHLDDLDPWFGERHVDLIRSANLELLGDDLRFFRSESAKIRFDRTFLDAWQINLTNPLYEFGRELAVRELAGYGRRFLDLACGLGHGAERIAQYCPEGCEIVCVDKSADFLEQARGRPYPGATVRFVRRDLNEGLPHLPEAPFDGALFNGSFHFIHDKPARLAELFDLLRPGALLVIGHCFCRSGFDDEPMHDLYFSLLADACYVEPFDDVRAAIAGAGFAEVGQYHRGSHSYVLAERLPDHSKPDTR